MGSTNSYTWLPWAAWKSLYWQNIKFLYIYSMLFLLIYLHNFKGFLHLIITIPAFIYWKKNLLIADMSANEGGGQQRKSCRMFWNVKICINYICMCKNQKGYMAILWQECRLKEKLYIRQKYNSTGRVNLAE